jgi:hypothetical protein
MSDRHADHLLHTDSMLVRMLEEDGWRLNFVARRDDRVMVDASLQKLAERILGGNKRPRKDARNESKRRPAALL